MRSTTRSPASCSSISTRRSRTCCSTASSGSCAMSTSRKGLAEVVEHYRAGIEAVAAALDDVLPEERQEGARRARQRADQRGRAGRAGAQAREPAGARRRARHRVGGGSHRQNRWRTSPRPISRPAPSSSSTASRTRRAASRSPTISTASRSTVRSTRSARRSGGSPPRWSANGATGRAAVDAWVAPRAGEVERIRAAVHGIASSGLTLSKLSVAASLLGDLVKN